MLDPNPYMARAMIEAEAAARRGEVPVGAVIVDPDSGEILAAAGNRTEELNDPTAHAEVVALRGAGVHVANYRLNDATLYVTLEPCVMCIGAMSHARIKRLVFGAYDPKRGAVCNALSLTGASFLNHRISWDGGVLETECSEMLRDFFKARR